MSSSIQPSNVSSEFISIHFSYLDNYFKKYESLKESEDWKEMVLLGELALEDPKGSLAQKAQIHAQLASSLYYLGEYDLCAEHANKCLLAAQYLNDTSYLLRSFYLLSAHKRALANFSTDPQQQKELFLEAKSYINKALSHFNRCEDDFLKAKVFFNGGAAQADDPNGDYSVALHWYKEAMALFKKLDKTDDYNRTAIRFARLALQINHLSGCEKTLQQIDQKSLTQKSKVHYLMVHPRDLIAKEQIPEASRMILDAIELAAQLEMKGDLERLNELLNSISKHQENVLNLLHMKC